MSIALVVRIEVESFSPYTLKDARTGVKEALAAAINETSLKEVMAREPEVVVESHLPSKEQVEILIVVAQFALDQGPTMWMYTKQAMEMLAAQLLGIKGETKLEFNYKEGGKTVSAKGLTPKDSVRILTEKMEVELRPRKDA